MGKRPKLSEKTVGRMRKMGVEPNALTDEELEAIEMLDNPNRTHWFPKALFSICLALTILALVSLLSGDWSRLFLFGFSGLFSAYLSYRIQCWIAMRGFRKAMERPEETNEESDG